MAKRPLTQLPLQPPDVGEWERQHNRPLPDDTFIAWREYEALSRYFENVKQLSKALTGISIQSMQNHLLNRTVPAPNALEKLANFRRICEYSEASGLAKERVVQILREAHPLKDSPEFQKIKKLNFARRPRAFFHDDYHTAGALATDQRLIEPLLAYIRAYGTDDVKALKSAADQIYQASKY